MSKIKILVISGLWNNNNSTGNTYTNLFGSIENIEIANIYTDFGIPNNNVVEKYYQITEKTLIPNFFNKKIKPGKVLYFNNEIDKKEINEIDDLNINKLNFARKFRFISTLIREFIWKITNWKSKELLNFIDDFKPDLIYANIYEDCYQNDLILFVKKYTKIPLVCLINDEIYYYKKYQYNIIKLIYKFFVRKRIFNVIKQSEFIDTFSNIQKEEYEKIFNIPFKIRYKSANIENIEIKKEYNNPLIFLYTGNLGNKRWENLVEIGKALDKINDKDVKAILNIYSTTSLTKEMENEFNNCMSLNFMGSVSGEEVQKIQSKADVLIHTESFDKKEIQAVRMSLSTKIIDYLAKGKCILAFGPKEVASMDYFVKNDCGYVIDNSNKLVNKISELVEKQELLYEFSVKALETAKKNHDPKKLQKKFYEDLLSVIKD